MKLKFALAALSMAVLTTVSARAQAELNITGATAFRAATITSIVAAYGGEANVRIVHSNSSSSNYTGANAISFRGNFTTVGDTIIRCRFSGSVEGLRDLIGNVTTANDVLYYPDTDIPALAGSANFVNKNENSNPVTANVALKPDVAFSDVQQTSTLYSSSALTLTGERVGVILFYFLKSEGSSVNLTNVTAQNWRAAVINNRGIPLNVFTGLSADQTGRVMATGRNDGSGTRHAYLIEPGMKPSQLVNQFKLGVNGFNGVTSAGFTGNNANFLQLWPASDAQDANNNSVVYPGGQVTGNGGYFSGSNVATLLGLNTSAVRVLGPTGTDLSSTGSYVGTSVGNPRAVSVIGWLGQSDAVNAIAAGAGILSYNGVLVTPVASGVDPTGLVPADRYKVTNGSYTAWTYERLFSRAPLTGTKDTIVHGTGGIVPSIPTNLANNGIAISAMVAVRVNDGDVVTQP